MNQDSSFPPMLPPSTELGALLFAVLPCLQESYRPLASFAYHMTELTRLKSIPSIPSLSGLSGIDTLITDKDSMLRSLSFYGKMFHMPLLSTIANLLQALQFYQTYKDMLPGLFSAFGGNTAETASPLNSMAGLFSGLGGSSGTNGSPDLFSMLGGLSPDLLASLFPGFSTTASQNTASASEEKENAPFPPPETEPSQNSSDDISACEAETDPGNKDIPGASPVTESARPDSPLPREESGSELIDSLYSFLSPEQKAIYDQLMHTD